MMIGALIQARLSSSRLPLKAVLHVGPKPLLCHQIDRLKTVSAIEKVAVSTTPLPVDDYLVELARRHGVQACRGPEDRPLTRHRMSAADLGLDVAVVTGGDNPFVDPELTKRLIEYHFKGGHDLSLFAYGRLPLGSVPWCVVNVPLLSAMEDEIGQGEDWLSQLILVHHSEFDLGVLREGNPDYCLPGLRITVDEAPDLLLTSTLAETLGADGRLFSLRDIVALLRERPELMRINERVKQYYPEYWTEFETILNSYGS